MTAIPPPPAGLSAEAKRLWATYHRTWSLDEHSSLVLAVACETFDRMRLAQAAIKRDGFKIRPGQQNPFAIERDARRDLVKLLKGVGVSLEPVRERGVST